MKTKSHFLYLAFALSVFASGFSQTVYMNTTLKKIYRANADNSVTLMVTTDIVLNDIAIDTNGNFYGITEEGKIVSIDMQTGITTTLVTLTFVQSGNKSLVCNDQNELFTISTPYGKLYKYSIATNEVTEIASVSSTPGDLTFYKGNLIFPGDWIGNEAWIRAYDFQTNSMKTIYCGSPTDVNFFFWGITNRFTSCNENEIIGWQQFVYNYDLDNHTATLSPLDPAMNASVMMISGLASDNEYLASNQECYVNLEPIDCALGIHENKYTTVEILPNPATETFAIHNKKEITAIEILDINGRFIKTLPANLETFDISDLQKGVYLVKISRNHQTMFKKLVKN